MNVAVCGTLLMTDGLKIGLGLAPTMYSFSYVSLINMNACVYVKADLRGYIVMKYKIYIPTYRRIDIQVTWNHLCDELKSNTILVCPSIELLAHRNLGREAVVYDGIGIAAKRNFILDDARRFGYQWILMLDDDLILQTRQDDGRITNSTPQEQMEAIKWLDSVFKTGYVHAGFAPRFLNWRTKGEWIKNQRMMAALAYNPQKLDGVSFCRGFEDFNDMITMDDFNM